MRKRLLILLVAGGISLLLTGYCLAAQTQMITFDPISSYEIGWREHITIPIGANLSRPGDCVIYVDGLPYPDMFIFPTTRTERRSAGILQQLDRLDPGQYVLTITAYDKQSGARSSATLKIKVTEASKPNSSIIFSPLESMLQLKAGQYVELAVTVTDQDPDRPTLSISGLPGQDVGHAKFVLTERKAGQAGGYLALELYRPGSYTINLLARDGRGNDAAAKIQINVAN